MKTAEEMKKVVDMMEQVDKFKAAVGEKYGKTMYAEHGRKFCKILRGSDIYCFIDLTNGDVLMAATYRAPAKHARSNIFAADLGLSGVSEYGANYLK